MNEDAEALFNLARSQLDLLVTGKAMLQPRAVASGLRVAAGLLQAAARIIDAAAKDARQLRIPGA